MFFVLGFLVLNCCNMPLSKATKALQCSCEHERKTPGITNVAIQISLDINVVCCVGRVELQIEI